MTSWKALYRDVDPRRVTHRICFNPNYGGGPTGVPGSCAVPIRSGKKGIKPETRERILLSIKRDGFRNPILVYNTHEGMFLSFGGGRLEAARKLGLFVPAIVIDYTGDMVGYEEVTRDNWREFFKDVPAYFEFNDVGISTHYGLESGRRAEFDAAGVAWASEDDLPAILKESPWLDDDA